MITHILLRIDAISVDLYTLFRMFKTPEGGIPGTLCLGYYGAGHVDMMVKILTSDPINYDLLYGHNRSISSEYPNDTKITSNNVNRCIHINHPIFLDIDTEQHYQNQIIARQYIDKIEEKKSQKHRYDLRSLSKSSSRKFSAKKSTRKNRSPQSSQSPSFIIGFHLACGQGRAVATRPSSGGPDRPRTSGFVLHILVLPHGTPSHCVRP
jgi:hypothetical protein